MRKPQAPRGPWVRFELERIEGELDRMAVEMRERGDLSFTVSHRKARQIALCAETYVARGRLGLGATGRALVKSVMLDAGMGAPTFDAMDDGRAVQRLYALADGEDELLPTV